MTIKLYDKTNNSSKGTSKENDLLSWDSLLSVSIGGLFNLAKLTSITAFPAAGAAFIMGKILKELDEKVTDALYEKQLNDFWKANREVTYKAILRQTELFGINSSVSKMDVSSYIQQWIIENPMYAKQFPAMIETALSYSQQMLDDATGGDVIEFYKKQVLSLMNWKEKYDRVYSTEQNPTGPSAMPKMSISNTSNPQKPDNEKTAVSPKAEEPSIGIDSVSVALSEKMDSQGYSGSGFSLGDFGKLDLQIGAAINLENDDLTPALENVASKTDEIINKIPAEEVSKFSENLLNASLYGQQIAAAFMNVDENIGKAIGSAATLTEGVAGIFKAFEGDKVNGLGLMSGIQGGFAGLQGLFGGEAGSDASQLLGGMGGIGEGVAGILTDNPLEGIASIISSLPSFIDGLTESTQEGYVKQLSKQGFNDTYSEGLLDEMSAVSDQKGDKSFGIKAYIEDFFKETDIDTKEEFGRMSDLLSESVGEYVAQGHTMDEAYGKFGDELTQLTAAQEKYGEDIVSEVAEYLTGYGYHKKKTRIVISI